MFNVFKPQKVTGKCRKLSVLISKKDEKLEKIKAVMEEFMDRVLREKTKNKKKRTVNPFSLLPDVVEKTKSFERTLSTSFGINVVENLAAMLANSYLGYGTSGYRIVGRINIDRKRRIDKIMNDLENTDRKPNFEAELAYILDGRHKKTVPTIVNCDLFTVNKCNNNKREAYECKSPFPNNDQAKAAKERILRLYSMEPVQIDDAYFALNYNPYGDSRSDYAWGLPSRWFGVKNNDPSVLIGREFWDKIGGRGTYDLIANAAGEIREAYSGVITKKLFTPTRRVYIKDPEALYAEVLNLKKHFDVKYRNS